MANGTTSTKELIEINKFKAPEVPNNDADALESARAKARELRNGRNRKLASELSGEYFKSQINPAIQDYENKTGLKLEQPGVKTDDNEAVTPDIKPNNQVADSSSNEDADGDDLDDESLSVKVTKTINGKKVTKTVKEWMELAAIQEAASDANTEARQQFEQRTAPPVRVPVVVDNDEEDLKLVQAIQEGTSEEAMAALRKLRSQGNEALAKQMEQERVQQSFRNVYESVRDANQEIAGDPYLWSIACQKDAEFANAGKVYDKKDAFNNMALRFQAAVDDVKAWDRARREHAVDGEKKRTLKLKKEKLAGVASQASSKVVGNAEDDSGPFGKTLPREQYLEQVAKDMERKRLQRRG